MELGRQIRMTLRGLRYAPTFTALAVLTLALGIGANALIFALADRALFRPLPYPDPDRLVAVLDGWGTSPGSLEILERELGGVQRIGGAIDARGMTLEPSQGPARRVSVAHVTPDYLHALGVEAREGRFFVAEESDPGRGRVVLLGSDFFTGVLGGEPGVVGSTLVLDGTPHEIVGVLPRGFDMPSARNDLWLPLTMDASPANVGYHWGMGIVTLVARLDDGATAERVRQEVLRVQEEVRAANPLWTPPPGFWAEARVTPLHESRSRWARAPLLVLLGAVSVVLLVVCANIANLLVSRGVARRRDLAVRTALGAGRRRLAVGQLLEVGLLSVLGTAVGLLLAGGGLELIRPLLPDEVPGASEAEIDLRVVAFTAGVALVVALLAAVVPALRASGVSPGSLLRDSGRGQAGSVSRRRTAGFLVTAQMASAVVLVAGAGLLGRSLLEMGRVDPGFVAEGRVTARLDLPPGLDHDREARARYLADIEEALVADPAIRSAALASSIPFGTESENLAVFIPGVTDDPNNLPVVLQRRVSASYFRVAAIPLRTGRGFDAGDRVGSPPVVVVDERFAERFFPGQDPVGRILRYPWRGAPDMQIVGVVGATGDEDLAADPSPTVWMPVSQLAGGLIDHAVVVAEGPAPDGALAAIQARMRAFDSRMAVSEVATYPELLAESMALQRLLTLLLTIFAGSTLVLGCVGVYGIAAFSARARAREIGVRMTLGAEPAEIRSRFLKEGLWLVAPGGVVGLATAAASARVLGSFLYQVSPLDPLTFVLTPLILVAAALVAVWAPARRATRVDPASVLRGG